MILDAVAGEEPAIASSIVSDRPSRAGMVVDRNFGGVEIEHHLQPMYEALP